MGVALDNKDSAAQRSSLVELTREAMHSGVVSQTLLQERLEVEALEELGLIDSFGGAALFHRKIIRVNTAIVYKQNKFNLLREVSRGREERREGPPESPG
jgi:THO complex subunit 2